ncbi:MAG: hypothetical protein QNJ34_15895 [Xenococcaceae cyanobacterium MO_188.B29]|nr:hypothetical protein [Xenococcaceae cyanobacterium MO_188.B29]
MAARNWTTEQKQQQSQLIQKWKPWKSSTGAKTPEGKARSSQNALKHGFRSREAIATQKKVNQHLRQLEQTIKDMNKATKTLNLDKLTAALSKLTSL